jgi:GxxExxY protein
MPTRRDAAALNEITSEIIAAAIRIHRAFGPGLLESVYLACLRYEVRAGAFDVEAQKAIPLTYQGFRIDVAYRADLVVADSVLVEVKALETLADIHAQQLYTYLRVGDFPVGLLLNFGGKTMKDGIKRVVNGFPE